MITMITKFGEQMPALVKHSFLFQRLFCEPLVFLSFFIGKFLISLSIRTRLCFGKPSLS